MDRYIILFSDDAENDFNSYIDYILYECKSPLTALRNYEELAETINQLKISPESFPIQPNLRYGFNVRRVNYKKMAIIYTVHGNVVYIHRILASAMITEL